MKVEVQFLAHQGMATDTHEAERVEWEFDEGYASILAGNNEESLLVVASYPEHRIVRLRVIS